MGLGAGMDRIDFEDGQQVVIRCDMIRLDWVVGFWSVDFMIKKSSLAK